MTTHHELSWLKGFKQGAKEEQQRILALFSKECRQDGTVGMSYAQIVKLIKG